MEQSKSANWFGTWNNPGEDGEAALKGLYEKGKATYAVGQLEKGESGTVHLQFYLNFASQQRFSYLKKLNGECHWEVVRVNKAAQHYVMKEETRVAGPWEFGARPKVNQNKASVQATYEQEAEKTKSVMEIGAEAALEQGMVKLQHYDFVEKALQKYKLKTMVQEDEEDVRGIWIMGKPGVGKSYVARNGWASKPYEKAQNKWWDGYNGQEVVIIEDMDTHGDKLSHHLKLWADRYAISGEVKGGTIPLHYRKLVVTSNYSI